MFTGVSGIHLEEIVGALPVPVADPHDVPVLVRAIGETQGGAAPGIAPEHTFSLAMRSQVGPAVGGRIALHRGIGIVGTPNRIDGNAIEGEDR